MQQKLIIASTHREDSAFKLISPKFEYNQSQSYSYKFLASEHKGTIPSVCPTNFSTYSHNWETKVLELKTISNQIRVEEPEVYPSWSVPSLSDLWASATFCTATPDALNFARAT
jgi:hypothetical protein